MEIQHKKHEYKFIRGDWFMIVKHYETYETIYIQVRGENIIKILTCKLRKIKLERILNKTIK